MTHLQDVSFAVLKQSLGRLVVSQHLVPFGSKLARPKAGAEVGMWRRFLFFHDITGVDSRLFAFLLFLNRLVGHGD